MVYDDIFERGITMSYFESILDGMFVVENKTTKELAKLAYFDQLTSVYNRNMLEEMRKHFDNVELFVTMVDIDGLKEINDQKGHISGDKVIKSVACLLHSSSKCVFRLGGDEFLLIDKNLIDLNHIPNISYSTIHKSENCLLTTAMHLADIGMYLMKEKKKKVYKLQLIENLMKGEDLYDNRVKDGKTRQDSE